MDPLAVLADTRRAWLVTGAAGFIGSHIVELLLDAGQDVIGLDNFASGSRTRIADFQASPKAGTFRFIEGDILDPAACAEAARDVDYVLHQAALTSVPESIAEPLRYNAVNVTGFVNVAEAARQAGARRLVYASSSAVYGASDAPQKRVGEEGPLLSPYAATKRINEVYAAAYGQAYGLGAVGLRYFNIFGPRQDPNGPYAAVIPTWLIAMLRGDTVYLNGSPDITRDFCHVTDVARANVAAALSSADLDGRAFNVAGGRPVTLGELFEALRTAVAQAGAPYDKAYVLREHRHGDIVTSTASITETEAALGFRPQVPFEDGLAGAARWYREALQAPV